MMVPEDFSKTTVSALGDYLHEFIVDVTLVDWLSITKKRRGRHLAGKSRSHFEEDS